MLKANVCEQQSRTSLDPQDKLNFGSIEPNYKEAFKNYCYYTYFGNLIAIYLRSRADLQITADEHLTYLFSKVKYFLYRFSHEAGSLHEAICVLCVAKKHKKHKTSHMVKSKYQVN